MIAKQRKYHLLHSGIQGKSAYSMHLKKTEDTNVDYFLNKAYQISDNLSLFFS